MRIHTLSIGRPQLMARGGRTVNSAINRKPVDGPARLESLGFVGDQPASTKHHGGPDRAVCCYAHEHYPYFREKLAAPLDVPAFGENLTTEGLLESDVCLGDTYRIGTALVQVSQPRQPCGTLAMRNECVDLPKWVNEKYYTGFYVRVIEPGDVRPGNGVALVGRCHDDVTIEVLMRAMLDKKTPRDELARLIALPPLSQGWKDTFTQRSAPSTATPLSTRIELDFEPDRPKRGSVEQANSLFHTSARVLYRFSGGGLTIDFEQSPGATPDGTSLPQSFPDYFR